jgi:hypothetical protein
MSGLFMLYYKQVTYSYSMEIEGQNSSDEYIEFLQNQGRI